MLCIICLFLKRHLHFLKCIYFYFSFFRIRVVSKYKVRYIFLKWCNGLLLYHKLIGETKSTEQNVMIPNKNIFSHSRTCKVFQHVCLLQVIPWTLKVNTWWIKSKIHTFFDLCVTLKLCSVSVKHVAHSTGQHEFACCVDPDLLVTRVNTPLSCAKAPYFFVGFVGKILLRVALLKIFVLHKQIGRKVRTGKFFSQNLYLLYCKKYFS